MGREICKATTEKLNNKLTEHLNLKVSSVERAYVGYWQRAQGAWSWFAYRVTEDGKETARDIGSPYTIKEILKAKYLSISYDGTIYPEENDPKINK